jgi:hypothetical protein
MAEIFKSVNKFIWKGEEMFDLLVKIKNEEGDLETVEIETAGYEGCDVEVTWLHTETEEETAERVKLEAATSLKNAESAVKAQERNLAYAKRKLEAIKKGEMPF